MSSNNDLANAIASAIVGALNRQQPTTQTSTSTASTSAARTVAVTLHNSDDEEEDTYASHFMSSLTRLRDNVGTSVRRCGRPRVRSPIAVNMFVLPGEGNKLPLPSERTMHHSRCIFSGYGDPSGVVHLLSGDTEAQVLQKTRETFSSFALGQFRVMQASVGRHLVALPCVSAAVLTSCRGRRFWIVPNPALVFDTTVPSGMADPTTIPPSIATATVDPFDIEHEESEENEESVPILAEVCWTTDQLAQAAAYAGNERGPRENLLMVSVRLGRELQDALRSPLRRMDTNFKSVVSITYMGQTAIDQGGPLRQFCDRAMAGIRARFLTGNDATSMLISDEMTAVLDRNDMRRLVSSMRCVGRLVGLAAMQGDIRLNCLAASQIHHLQQGNTSLPLCLPMSQLLKELESSVSPDVEAGLAYLRADSGEIPETISALGFHSRPMDFEGAVRRLAHQHLILSRVGQLAEFRSGLEDVGFINFAHTCQHMWAYLVHIEDQLSAAYIQRMLPADFGDLLPGSNSRTAAEETYMCFLELLGDLEVGLHMPHTLKTVLQFLTGTLSMPAAPLVGSCEFVEDTPTCRPRPSASTCAVTLTLPITSGAEFTKRFIEALDNAAYFGNV